MADWASQRLAELWYGVDVSATSSTRRLLPPLGMVGKSYCLPLSRTLEAASAALGDVEDSVPLSPPAKQLLMSCDDVEDSDPVFSTSEAAPDEL